MSSDQAERTVFISNIHEDVTKELLEELFVQIGPIYSVNIRDDKNRYAFCEFASEESVIFACKMLDRIRLFGMPLTVKPRNKSEKEKEWFQLKKQEQELVRRFHQGSAGYYTPQPNHIPYRYQDKNRARSFHGSQQQQNQYHHNNRQQYYDGSGGGGGGGGASNEIRYGRNVW